MPGAASPRTKTLRSVPGVEIFATGTFNGETWTLSDLAEIARNFNELGPHGKDLLKPPVVLGHEEDQEFLERTDIPAAGWPSRVWVKAYRDDATGRMEGILKADFGEVPEEIAKLVDARAYRKVSSEIYDDFTDDFGVGHGKALRRVSLLGGEIPKVKRLADIPLSRFGERGSGLGSRRASSGFRFTHATKSPRGGTTFCFSEVVSMDRTAAIAAIKAAMPNMDQVILDGMSDEQLIALASNLPAPSALSAPNPDAAGDTAMMADMPATREDLIAAIVALGQDPAALEAMDDAGLQSLWMELTGGTEAVTPAAPPETALAETPRGTTGGGARQSAPSGRQPQKVTLQFAERYAADTLRKAQATNAALSAANRQLATRQVEQKRQTVKAFTEQLVSEGRIRPVDVPAYTTALMCLDDTRPVHKFAENGRTTMVSAFEAKKRELAKLPVVIHFGEKIPGGAGGKPDASAETEKVRRFAESAPMADALKTTGKKPEQYVHAFTERLKKDPGFTAAKYGVPDEYS